jgi:hypothetical protein
MSLSWDLSKIENYDELFVDAPPDQGEGKVLDGLTQAIIYATMVTGLGKNWSLDTDFAPELWARLHMIEKLQGPLVTKQGEPYFVTFEDVRRRIGLETNVSPVSRSEFVKRMLTNDMDRLVKQAKRELELERITTS